MNGYTRIPHALMRNPNLPPIAKVVWSLIAGMKPGFNVTLAQICKMVACHPNTWRSTVKMLEGYGMVAVEHSPNGVTYTAVTDMSKWTVEGNKNCEGNKICNPNKNCNPKGNKNCEGEGNKICDPSEEHIEEQKKNNIVVDEVRARIREEVMTDAMVEMGCMSLGIDRGTYENLAFQVFTDWDFQDLPDSEWTKAHFIAVMRYKVKDLRNGNQRTNNNGNAADTSPESFARYFAAKELERRAAEGVGNV